MALHVERSVGLLVGKDQLFVNNNGRHGEKNCVNIFLFFVTKNIEKYIFFHEFNKKR